jgi:hypothetical protein
METEIDKLFRKYSKFNKGKRLFEVIPFGVSEEECNILFGKPCQFERPDICSFTNGSCFGIECFEYDAYRHNKNGSVNRKEDARIKKTFDNESREKLKSQNSVFIFSEFKSKPEERYYKENFTKTFKQHYAKVDEYKSNISTKMNIELEKISIWFMAEDTAMLGPKFKDSNNSDAPLKPALPLYFDEIAKLFLRSTKIDGIIFISDHLPFILVKRNEEAINALKETYDYKGEPLIFSDPKVIDFSIKIPKVK